MNVTCSSFRLLTDDVAIVVEGVNILNQPSILSRCKGVECHCLGCC